MITFTRGNILKADTEAIVNAVNCVGVMGKGLALQFKKAYPANFELYQTKCNSGEVATGRMLIFETGAAQNPRYIINFPTKQHWRAQSQIEFIDSGLVSLVESVTELKIRSLAIPGLGCGLGGLNWNEVRPRIESAFLETPNIEVLIFEPN